ncbi:MULTISPECIES: hypothetical protein [unclassified Streptomyces]|uniref:hypothetical protein n=1 Tax=unclassified Streptomyces TaxID=2593676 RepID=UPI0033D0D76A
MAETVRSRRRLAAHAVLTALALSISAMAVTGCDASTPSRSASSSTLSSDPPSVDTPISEAGKKAEQVQSAVNEGLTHYYNSFGEGIHSPCTPAARTLFSDKCRKAGEAIQSVARDALKDIGGSEGFPTLREQAQITIDAFSGYRETRCAGNPQAAKPRSLCVHYGSVLAQAPSNLRDGVTLGLAGK